MTQEETTATQMGNVLSWANDLDAKTMAQAHRTANALDRLVRAAPNVRSEKFNAKKIASQFGTDRT